MNDVIVYNWNNKVGPNDIVYILGDFALTSTERTKYFLENLNGKKIFILGDHDKQIWQCRNYFEEITPLKNIRIMDIPITLCHYCMRVWSKSHYNSWHLYGHSHGHLSPIGKSHDVGVDNNNFAPVSFDEIKTIMDNRPNNANYIKDR